jgi:hypothetical protein
VSVFGALFTSGLVHNLTRDLPAGIAARLHDAGGGSLQLVATLPAEQRLAYKIAFADALTTVFTYAVPIMAVALLLTWLLKEVPLRGETHGAADTGRELAVAAAAPGAATPQPVAVAEASNRGAGSTRRGGRATRSGSRVH